MSVDARDPVLAPYRTILAYGAIGIVIFIAGFIEYLHFEPFGPHTGVQAHIAGVFSYDPKTNTTSGSNRDRFKRSEQFAAVVDWSGIPDTLNVQAIWIDSFENVVGSAGPATTIVPAVVPEGLKYHLPGQYIFAVERLEGGRPVEVLARRIVFVDRL